MWLVKWESAFNQWVNTSKVGNLFLSLSHYRTLVLALLLTHVITKKSYEMDCASRGKCADCMTKWCRSIEGLQVSTGFVIPISRYWFFLNCRLNRNRAQQLFFAVLHQRCTALHKSCLLTLWLYVAIFWHLYGSAPAALSIATAASTQSQKCTAAVNGKQRSWNLSASLVAVLISH